MSRRMTKRQQRWLGLTLGVMAVGLANVTTVAQAAPAVVQQGYTLLDRGWVNDAITTFRQAVQLYPQSLEAKLGLAVAYQRAGQDSNAWNAYQRVLAQDPYNRTALTAIGLLGGYRSEWQAQGITALTTLLNLSANDNAARAQRALLYGYQGNFAAALADYQPVLAANPSADVLLGAAQVYSYSGDYATALSLFNRYLAAKSTIPNSAVAAYATTLQKTGNPGQAVRILDARLQSLHALDDTAIQIRSALATAYAADGQLDRALQVLDPLRNTDRGTLPLARALSTIGRDQHNADLFDSAVALYQQVLQRTSQPSAGLLTEIADVLGESPSTQAQALQLYQQLVAQQPQNQSLRVKQLATEQQLGQIANADLWQQLQAVLTPLPTDSADRRSLALALLRIDSPDPALLPIYQDLAQDSDQPFFNIRIAQIELQQGNLAQAQQRIAAYQNTPQGAADPVADLLLAEVDRRAGNLEASANRYQALIDRNLGDEINRDALRGLAGIRLAEGQLDQALAVYDKLVMAYPDATFARLGQAGVAYQRQRISQTEAEAVLNQWLADHPNAGPPSELFVLAGALPAAPSREALYDRLLTIDPYNIAITRRWVQLWAARDPNKATARVAQLIAHDPNQTAAYFVQGELAQSLGDLPLASQAYETILVKQPNDADALSALGGVRFQQKQYGDAVRLYRQVLALKPNDLETQRILAELSLAQDQPIAALQQLRHIQDQSDRSNLDDRIRQVQADILRRRGFQPYWERY